jgi:anti-sigma B factor antagonist
VTSAASQRNGRATTPTADHSPYLADAATVFSTGQAEDLALCTAIQLLELSLQHYPRSGVCAVMVEGELDMLTAPLLEGCVREQLAAAPTHLVLDLEQVRFLGSSGLNCLLRVRELIHQAGLQLHLAGLISRVVARPFDVTGLRGLFDIYPTLTHAVGALVHNPEVPTADGVAPAPVLTAMWCCSVGTTWTLELRALDRDTKLGEIVDWISSGVPVTQPKPDALACELLTTRGLRLFHDPSTGTCTDTRHRIGYVCADAEVITLADLVRDVAAEAPCHPVMLAASWIAAGFSADAAAGWIRAGCLFPK